MLFSVLGDINVLCNEVLFSVLGDNNVLHNKMLFSVLGNKNVLFLLLFITDNTLLYHLHLEYHFNTFI